jgi:hypothetical protein
MLKSLVYPLHVLLFVSKTWLEQRKAKDILFITQRSKKKKIESVRWYEMVCGIINKFKWDFLVFNLFHFLEKFLDMKVWKVWMKFFYLQISEGKLLLLHCVWI